MEFNDILHRKQSYYGKTEASFHFAFDKFILNMINKKNKKIVIKAGFNLL